MAGRMQDKVVVITGAASGIGAEASRLFISEGASVVLADLQFERADALAKQLGSKARAIACDVSREAQVEAAVQLAVTAFGRLDAMINNAGIVGAVGSVRDITEDDWNKSIAILLNGVFFGIKHAARVMVPQKSGAIISVASVAGLGGGLGGHAYTAGKTAVIGVTRSAAAELAASHIRVNAVCPGSVPTALTGGIRGSIEAAEKGSADYSPMGQPIRPIDIAEAFLYLAADSGRFVNAQTIVVDGGMIGTTRGGAGFHAAPASYIGVSKL